MLELLCMESHSLQTWKELHTEHQKIIFESYNPQEVEITPEQKQLREYLNNVDETLLRRIFLDYFVEAGGNESAYNYVPLASTKILVSTANKPPFGGFNFREGVKIYTNNLEGQPERTFLQFIHEQAHAVSATHPTPANVVNNATERAASGFMRFTGDDGPILVQFNEGMTEWVTADIIKRYCSERNERYFDAEILAKLLENKLIDAIYTPFLRYVHYHSAVLAACSGQPVGEVYESLRRSYFANGEIVPTELVENLGEKGKQLKPFLQQVATTRNLKTIDAEHLTTEMLENELISTEIAENINNNHRSFTKL